MQAHINKVNKEKTINFFTSFFNKKEYMIPDIEIPESISSLEDSQFNDEENIGIITEIEEESGDSSSDHAERKKGDISKMSKVSIKIEKVSEKS